MKKKNIIISAIVVSVLSIGWWVFGGTAVVDNDITVEVEKGDFIIEVNTSGELEAKNSIRIMGPTALRAARIWQVKIDNMVDEGTVVDSGGYIARLDPSEINDKIANSKNEMDQSESKYIQVRMDTALTLREARDQLINLEYNVRQKELIVEQSQYEPPATQKQNEIELEKAKREYQQAKENYKIKKEKAVAEMREAAAVFAEDRTEYEFLQKLSNQFTVMAPADGMVIYHKDWDGTKIGEGSTINGWDPVVATLPDLSTMISKTYINEIDIRNVKAGQSVFIGLDAFPDKKLTGKIVSVANVGEQKPNSDAKVFEVRVEINESDSTLRPSMTTSNRIIIEEIPDVLHIPLECLHSQGDSITYVYKKEGINIVKQEVMPGKVNENESVINEGLEQGDIVYLNIPESVQDKEIKQLTASLEQ
ncbi:MAG TPA: RND transporter [Cytophagales bacterium]|jgi:HlyD family secretion protein|nr:RND transporter [Cytophagales bacterium]